MHTCIRDNNNIVCASSVRLRRGRVCFSSVFYLSSAVAVSMRCVVYVFRLGGPGVVFRFFGKFSCLNATLVVCVSLLSAFANMSCVMIHCSRAM